MGYFKGAAMIHVLIQFEVSRRNMTCFVLITVSAPDSDVAFTGITPLSCEHDGEGTTAKQSLIGEGSRSTALGVYF